MQPLKISLVFRRNLFYWRATRQLKTNQMNHQKTSTAFLFLLLGLVGFAQEDDNQYITFNDRRNTVHGVYIGFTMGYGEIDGQDTYVGGFKVAYVANQQFEVGFLAKGLYSQQNLLNQSIFNDDDGLFAGYAGFHLEPILFGKSRVSLSFPLFIGAGAVGYVDQGFDDDFDLERDDVDAVFVLEPGVSALFNLSRYVQLEAGLKHRFSSQFDLPESPVDRINGFTGEIGIKVGIFNMGRNRYKKQLDDE